MTLCDLDIGTELILYSHAKDGEVSLVTKIKGFKEKVVLLETIIVDGYAIDFTSPRVITDIYLDTETMYKYVFKNMVVLRVRLGSKSYHICRGDVEAIQESKRNAPRFDVLLSCIFQPGAGRKPFTSTLIDVSQSGLGVLSNAECETGSTVYVQFDISIKNDQTLTLRLQGTVVRVVKESEEEFFYGIKLDKENSNLNKYIAKVQREQLKLSYGKL